MLAAQSFMTLCDSMDCSQPGSPVCGILQARILEWVPFLSSEDLPDPGIELRSPALQVDSLPSEPPGKPLFLSGSLSEPPCPTPLAYIKPKQAKFTF